MRIGELAGRAGVTVEAVRFYEARGLMPEPERLPNNYRDYTAKHLARLHFIHHCRLLGMSLDEIARLTQLAAGKAGDFAVVHETVRAHIVAIEARIAELTALKEKLLALECRCSGNHEGQSCGILEELESEARCPAGGGCTCEACKRGQR